MEPVYMFGYKLAELTKLNESASVGLLCLAIKDAGKNTKEMGFHDYRTVFQTHLSKRLEKIKVNNTEKVIAEMMTMLNQKQSIFTMAAR